MTDASSTTTTQPPPSNIVLRRDPQDVPITFEELKRVLRNPELRPIVAVNVYVCTTDRIILKQFRTLDFKIETDRIVLEGGVDEIFPDDQLEICWFMNRLSFILLVFRTQTQE